MDGLAEIRELEAKKRWNRKLHLFSARFGTNDSRPFSFVNFWCLVFFMRVFAGFYLYDRSDQGYRYAFEPAERTRSLAE